MMENTYKAYIELYNQKNKSLSKQSRLYLMGKLTSFVIAATFVYFTYNHPSVTNITSIILFGGLYILFCILDNRCINRMQAEKAKIKVCENEIQYLNGDFTAFDDGSQYVNPKHEYTYDLDIFGQDSLFNRINRTITCGGSDLLAQKLSHPTLDRKEIECNRSAIDELKGLDEWRIKFMSNMPIKGNIDKLGNTYKKSRLNNILFSSGLPYLIILITLATLVFCTLDMMPWRAFTSMFLIQFFISIIIGKTTAAANNSSEQLHKEYKCYLNVLDDIYRINPRTEKLKEIKTTLFYKGCNSLEAFSKLSKILHMFEQRSNIFMYVLLNGILLFDLMLTRKFISWNKRYSSHIKGWTDAISEMDALTSLATYAYNNPTNRPAEVLDKDSENIIEATDVYHPFLNHKKAVPNSFTLKKKNISIITGANMAGKSTFLRTIGITYILASNGVPVCAKEFKFSTVTLFSSMRTSDDLANDISYFNAELLRLKQLIEHIKTHHYTLIILDEILKGTNSKDKLKGSIMFLNEISRYHIAAIIATHDLELAKLEDEQKDIYKNYCFEIELSEDIQYTYKIQRGVAQNLNASYLLANILKSISE